MKTKAADIRFVAEAPLGKLAKWLRILGFDALYDADGYYDGRETIETYNRIRLTRTQRRMLQPKAPGMIFIRSNDPMQQAREVVGALNLVEKDIQLFSRCANCNVRVHAIDKASIYGHVPDYVWETHAHFSQCGQCSRIYWPGSHMERVRGIVKKLFND